MIDLMIQYGDQLPRMATFMLLHIVSVRDNPDNSNQCFLETITCVDNVTERVLESRKTVNKLIMKARFKWLKTAELIKGLTKEEFEEFIGEL